MPLRDVNGRQDRLMGADRTGYLTVGAKNLTFNIHGFPFLLPAIPNEASGFSSRRDGF